MDISYQYSLMRRRRVMQSFAEKNFALKREKGEQTMHENEISSLIIGAVIEVHKVLGPGLLDKIYEDALCHELELRNIRYERQKAVPVVLYGNSIIP
jgi:hypothetical protein